MHCEPWWGRYLVPGSEYRADVERIYSLLTTDFMTWVKICGMTNLEDALVAVEAGADAVGFVFYEKSPRNIEPEVARKIVEKLPEALEKIGVFVGDLSGSLDVVFSTGLTGLQSYSSPADEAQGEVFNAVKVCGLPRRPRLIVALPMGATGKNGAQDFQREREDYASLGETLSKFSSLFQGSLDTFVLDSGDLRTPGGTGKTFDWKKAVPIAEGMRQGGIKLVVAGGLTAENVGEAIAILKPWGVDVVSGVEASPGKKDPEKVRAFVKAVRAADSAA
jgi:phosphoribosylanthranilate isomerase